MSVCEANPDRYAARDREYAPRPSYRTLPSPAPQPIVGYAFADSGIEPHTMVLRIWDAATRSLLLEGIYQGLVRVGYDGGNGDLLFERVEVQDINEPGKPYKPGFTSIERTGNIIALGAADRYIVQRLAEVSPGIEERIRAVEPAFIDQRQLRLMAGGIENF